MNEIMSWLTSQGLHIGSLVIKAVLIAVVGYVLIRMVVTIVENIISKSNMEKAAHSLIITLTRTVLYVLLALILASSVGIDVQEKYHAILYPALEKILPIFCKFSLQFSWVSAIITHGI